MVPIGIRGLLLHFDRVLDSDLFECAIPPQNAVGDRLPKFLRNRVVDPKHDRLNRVAKRCVRILLAHIPSQDHARHFVHAQRLGRVEIILRKVSNPRVRIAGLVTGVLLRKDEVRNI